MSARILFLVLCIHVFLNLRSKPKTFSPVATQITVLKRNPQAQLPLIAPQPLSPRFNLSAVFKSKYFPSPQSFHSSNKTLRGTFDWSTPGAFSISLSDSFCCVSDPHSIRSVSFIQGLLRIKVPGTREIISVVPQDINAVNCTGDLSTRDCARRRRVFRPPTRSRTLPVAVFGFHFAGGEGEDEDMGSGDVLLLGLADGNVSIYENMHKALSMIRLDSEAQNAQALVNYLYSLELHRLQLLIDTDGEDAIDTSPPHLSSDVKCDFEIHMRYSFPSATRSLKENPASTFTTTTTRPQISTTIKSPMCDLYVKTLPTTPIPHTHLTHKLHVYATLILAISISQLFALLAQIAYTNTPAKRLRVCPAGSVGVFVFTDAYLSFVCFVLGVKVMSRRDYQDSSDVARNDAYLVFISCVFVLFLGFGVFGVRYLLDLWKERSSGSIGVGVGTLYSRFVTYLVAGVVGLYHFGSTSPVILGVVGVGVSGCWLPQIIGNVQRNSRNALHPHYLFINSTVRLILPLYFLVCPHNILQMTLLLDEPNIWLASTLVLWVAAQVAVLTLQDIYGPRFLVPEFLYPTRHDYHPSLNSTILAACHLENRCAICFDSIFESQSSTIGDTNKSSIADVGSVAGETTLTCARDLYMVTPCRHLFHTECLERWMDMKLECPVCRMELPLP